MRTRDISAGSVRAGMCVAPLDATGNCKGPWFVVAEVSRWGNSEADSGVAVKGGGRICTAFRYRVFGDLRVTGQQGEG